MASGKYSMAAVSRRLARADGVSIVLEYAKRRDTCSEARTAPRVGSICLTEASACFAYDSGSEHTFGRFWDHLRDLRFLTSLMSADVNKRTSVVSPGGLPKA